MSLIRFGELEPRVARLAAALASARPRPRVAGLLADNGPDWVLVDLAAQRAGVVLVPLPAFFTAAQRAHVIAASGMDYLFGGALPGFEAAGEAEGIAWWRREAEPAALQPAAAKITFTSGTTGAPKAVRLSAAQQWTVARALAEATRPLGLRRHLCLLPLSVLLENVAGVYAPQLTGAECCVPPLAEVGMSGSSRFEAAACLAAIERWQPDSVILLPQMLLQLSAAVAQALLDLLRRPVRERLLGMPERLFARVNQLLPGLVDRALRRQLSTIRRHAPASPEADS